LVVACGVICGEQLRAGLAEDSGDTPSGLDRRRPQVQEVVDRVERPAQLWRAAQVVGLCSTLVLAAVRVPFGPAKVAQPRGEDVEPGVLECVDVRLRDRRAVLPEAGVGGYAV